MISLSKGAMNVAGAKMYFDNHLSVRDYYAQDETFANGYVLGKAAEQLGLSKAEITSEQFERLLQGCDPNTGAALRSKANHGDVERAGWDLTLSPPKSVSIHALVAGDRQLIAADREAAIRAVQEVESCALTRQHGGKQWVQSGNVVAVMFEHHEARESVNGEHGPMPQLHHHTFIANLTRRGDGQWRGLDPDQIYKSRNFVDAVYMSELSKNVQALGYQIERRSDGRFELAGYTRKQIEAFSERARDIEDRKAELKIKGTMPQAVRENIILATRKAKREYDPETLKAEHQALAVEHGIDLSYRPTIPVRTFAVTPEAQAERSLDFAIRHLTNRQAVADHRDIALTALRHGIGATDIDHLRARITAEQQKGNLIAAGHTHLHPLDKYTTREMVRLERENLTLVRDQMNRGRPIAGIAIRSAVDGQVSSTGTREVREWAAAKKLLPDQTEAAVLNLTTPKWASAIEGLAGTTKTTLVGAINEYAQDHCWTVHGFGTSSGARNALIDAGIDAQTVAKVLASPLPAKTGRELWIIDESSLLATVPVNQLLKLAVERGVERILFVGDQKQHLAIGAGHPVLQFLNDNMVVAHLTTIRRQKDPDLRKVVELSADYRPSEAIDLLLKQKRIAEIPDTAQRYERIAAEYLNAYEAKLNCRVLSPGNDERRDLNEAIRSTLVAHKYVATLGQEHQILIPRDMTPEQLTDARSYHEGDVVYFRRGSKQQAIPKRAYLTVASVNDDTLSLRAENGRPIEFDPTRWKGLSVYTSETRTIAVGDRLEWREPDNKRRIANHEYGTIQKLDGRNIEVKFDKGRKLSMPLSDARKVDLGYASTSHASQGSTVQRVVIHVDSARHVNLVNLREWYVDMSRPEDDARVYTDNVQGMRRAVSRPQDKELALDVVKQRPTRGITMGI